MPKTISQDHNAKSNESMRLTLGKLQGAIVDQILTSGGLVIGSSAKTKVKIANTVYALVNGKLVKKTTAEIVLAGTVVNAKFNVFVLTIDVEGAVTSHIGTPATLLADVLFPIIPDDQAVIGFVIVNPTGTGNFVGATTDLDDATVAPNAVYINTVGTFNPNILEL